jgi:DNA repair and recombination protein RAD52
MTQFTDAQIESLKSPLARDVVKTREQGKSTLSYIESWHAIDEANRIFGFDAWDRETTECRCVCERERKIGQGQYQRDGWGVTYVAKVRITVGAIIREGSGAGHGIDADLGLAHESAIKEAESDAMKRALMTFGNQFGLALYDKTQANVEGTTPPNSNPPKQNQPRTTDQRGAQGRREVANQQHKGASKNDDTRKLYSALEKDMRLCQLADDLVRWWKDSECIDLRNKLPESWQKNLYEEFVKFGKELRQKDDGGFPGSDTAIRNAAGRTLHNAEAF